MVIELSTEFWSVYLLNVRIRAIGLAYYSIYRFTGRFGLILTTVAFRDPGGGHCASKNSIIGHFEKQCDKLRFVKSKWKKSNILKF